MGQALKADSYWTAASWQGKQEDALPDPWGSLTEHTKIFLIILAELVGTVLTAFSKHSIRKHADGVVQPEWLEDNGSAASQCTWLR